MKTRILYFLSSWIFFIFMFYDQSSIGLNLFFFTIVIIGLSLIYVSKITTNIVLSSIGLLIVSSSIAWYGDWFSILFDIFLLLIYSVFVFEEKSKIILTPFKSAINYLLAIIQTPEFFKEINLSKTSKLGIKFSYFIIIPILIISLFTYVYTLINQQFGALFNNICFPELNYNLLFISFLGGIYTFGFWYYKNWIKEAHYLPNSLNDSIKNKSFEETEQSKIWLYSAIFLFSSLNAVLLLLLYFDFSEIISGSIIPEDRNQSEYVHEGIYAVILSILLAILLIAIYFKDRLNFMKDSKYLKYTCYIWIGLNFILLITSYLKNNTYIESYGLTFKRLGVIGFIFLSSLGLIVTIIKVRKNKSFYYILKNMAWILLIFGVFICPINWSYLTTKYNLTKYEQKEINLDLNYLKNLDYNHRLLINFEKINPTFKSTNIINYTFKEELKQPFLSKHLYYQYNKDLYETK